jgi:hypothetical protein
VVSAGVTQTLPAIVVAMRCHISIATLCQGVPTFCRGCWMASQNSLKPPGGISYYLLGGGGGCVNPSLGLKWTWLQRNIGWLRQGCFGRVRPPPPLLKPSVRQIPSCCLSRGNFPVACVVCWPNGSLDFYFGSLLRSRRGTHVWLLPGKRL